MAISYMVAKDYPNAEINFRRAIDVNPNWTWGHIKLAKTIARLGRTDEALAEAEIAEELLAGSGTPAARCWRAFTYARCGLEDRARANLAELRELEPAIEALEQSLAERSPNLVYYKISPALYLDELGDDPRFQAMIRTIGFE